MKCYRMYQCLVLLWGLFGFEQSMAASAYVQIQNSNSGLCLQIAGSSKAAGALVQQVTCASNASNTIQSFLAVGNVDGSYTFKNKITGLCLELKDAARGLGVAIQQNICNSLSHQRFTPKFVRTNQYLLVSQVDGGCFRIENGSKTAGAIVRKYNCTESLTERFGIKVISGSIPLAPSGFTDPVAKSVSGPNLSATIKGVNITGAESGGLVGSTNKMFTTYAFPTPTMIDYFLKKGFTAIRFPFKQARLQPKLSGPLDLVQLAQIDKVVQYARSKGMWVILDPHDYGIMYTNATAEDGSGRLRRLIGSSKMPAVHFANFWARLARVYAGQPNVIFNIMNEPASHKDENGVLMKMIATTWQSAAISAVSAIRSQGAHNFILIPGVAWTGAHSWVSSKNGDVWSYFHDTRYAFDVHQYLDPYYSGTTEFCEVGAGSSANGKGLAVFTKWALTYGKRGFISEMGWAENPGCMKEGQDMLAHINANSKVYRGWTYFGAGWYTGFYSLNPYYFNTTKEKDRAQIIQLQDSLY